MKRLLFVAVLSSSLAGACLADEATQTGAPEPESAGEAAEGGTSPEEERAAHLKAAEEAFRAGRTTRAAKELTAVYGEAEAAYRLALRFERGAGVKANLSKAWQWIQRAAEKGHVQAQIKAAEYLTHGTGTAIDRAKAFAYYRKAAEQGNAKALAMVGLWQVRGIGTPVNYVDGVRNLRRAAEAGEPLATATLDRLRKEGRPVDFAWLSPPTAAEDEPAALVLREVEDILDILRRQGQGWLQVESGPVEIAEAEEGYDVVVPTLAFVAAGNRLDMGDLKMRFRPRPDGNFVISLTFPAKSVLRDQKGNEVGSLSLGDSGLTGTWLSAQDMLGDYRSFAQDVRLALERAEGDIMLTVASASSERVPTLHPDAWRDMRDTTEIRNLALELTSQSDRLQARIDSVKLDALYRGVNLMLLQEDAHKQTPWLFGSEKTALGELIDGVDISFTTTGVALDGTGERTGAEGGSAHLDDLHVRLAVEAAGTLDFDYRHHGLSLSGVRDLDIGLIPETVRVSLGLGGVPLDQRMAFAAMMAAQGEMTAAVEQTGATLAVREMLARALDYEFDIAGEIKPSADGLDGTLLVRVRGLDRLLREAQAALPASPSGAEGPARDPMALVALMREQARHESDEEGRAVEVFEITFAGGEVLVNGQPLPLERQ